MSATGEHVFEQRGGSLAEEGLDTRKAEILQAIVQEYVRGGEPIGSRRLVDSAGLRVSPATVRSEMAALEDAGYITQPHTSAGRVPTEKGYRYFVDALTRTSPVRAEQRAALQGLLEGSLDLEDLLRRASGVLSRLTRYAGLVVAPRLDRSRLRHVELVRLGPTTVLAVLIADTGWVEKRLLDLEIPVEEHDVQRACHTVNEAAAGLRTAVVPDVVAGVAAGAPAELRMLVEAIGEAVRTGLVSPPVEEVFVGGSANIAAAGYFEELEQVQRVYEILEEQVLVLRLLRDVLSAGDPAVRIGGELPRELTTCSVVAASYEAAGEPVGSVGVLGPIRMDYPRTLGAVQAVASSLESVLAEIMGDPEGE